MYFKTKWKHPSERKGKVLFNDVLQHNLFTVIWRQTYGKGPF